MSQVKERPIPFCASMVRAVLAENKTQTRRIAPFSTNSYGVPFKYTNKEGAKVFGLKFGDIHELSNIRCPYGVPGERLWVREEHYRFGHWEPIQGKQTKLGKTKWQFVADTSEIRYAPPESFRGGRRHKDPGTPAWHKRLARFMPHQASRILLEIVSVRVERLQDISEADAIAEGGPVDHPNGTACSWYQQLWEQINGAGSWSTNPWVWVVEFRRIQG
nr:hypothetical protein [uncultured Pseudogulbenkiania sp.]